MNEPLKILVVGGDPRRTFPTLDNVEVRRLGSRRYAGNGSIRSVQRIVRNRRVDLVVLLVRWMGHPAAETITAACKKAGVHWIRVPGGASSACRAVTLHLTEVTDG